MAILVYKSQQSVGILIYTHTKDEQMAILI